MRFCPSTPSRCSLVMALHVEQAEQEHEQGDGTATTIITMTAAVPVSTSARGAAMRCLPGWSLAAARPKPLCQRSEAEMVDGRS